MELTTLDKELLDGLQVLTDLELSRVQAHLAAGLPMRVAFGWPLGEDGPACFGCVVGTAMGSGAYAAQAPRVHALAFRAFPGWARALDGLKLDYADAQLPLTQPTLDRLAALLDMEWSRRHPLPNESGHDAIIPSLEAVPA